MFVVFLLVSLASAALPAPFTIPHLNNQFYGHGAFFGAAGQLLNDEKWNFVLQSLMPDVHEPIMKILSSGGGSKDVLLKFENNPVSAAYGIMKLKEMDDAKVGGFSDRLQKMQAFEWDQWLASDAVAEFKETGAGKDSEVASRIAETSIIAHGNIIETIAESKLGIRQYSLVVNNAKTDQGGVRPNDWIDIFFRSIELVTANETHFQYLSKGYQTNSGYFLRSTSKVGSQLNTFQNKISFPAFANFFEAKFGKQFTVLLDIKCRDTTPHVLEALIYQYNQRNILVHAIGDFTFSENAGVDKFTQTLSTGATFPGPIPIKFFSYNGDLQQACLKGVVKPGDLVMYNGGSMISYDKLKWGEAEKDSYKVSQEMLDQLRYYKKKFGFEVSLYVQENDIDERAATILVNLVNDNSDIFSVGFAWGGLDGTTASDIQPTLTDATVGADSQSLIGVKWDTSIPLP